MISESGNIATHVLVFVLRWISRLTILLQNDFIKKIHPERKIGTDVKVEYVISNVQMKKDDLSVTQFTSSHRILLVW